MRMRARRFAMMTNDEKTKAAELKAVIAATAGAVDGAPPQVRAAAVALKREVKRAGTTAHTLAVELGIHQSTLCRWDRDVPGGRISSETGGRSEGEGTGFRRVRVATSSAAPPVPMRPGLRVAHAPSGLVIDGLDVESLAALLRRMA